ncbi:phage tail protein [Duganella sp. FT135W]|uniref:Phage tail protein n=1 Tax=Duganella flavida TaxID=2692175 RepID=A0A6L8KMG3_9BURK|nr:phage tail tube protein [Duganella flavida]MYM25781.1 phage tail protein [Duganella flavida]
MAQVPTGTTFFIASAFAAAKPVTIATNATEAVITAVGHGYANGDIVEITSGWGRINRRDFRIKGITTDTFVLEGQDTTNTTFFPAGTGGGSVRKISTFTQITTVMSPSSSGGDPKTVNYKYLESDVEFSINDGFGATSYNMNLDADSIGSPGYTALKSLTEVQTDTCLKMVTRSGSIILQPCTVALNEAVKLTDGQINQVSVAFNGNNRLTRYAA